MCISPNPPASSIYSSIALDGSDLAPALSPKPILPSPINSDQSSKTTSIIATIARPNGARDNEANRLAQQREREACATLIKFQDRPDLATSAYIRFASPLVHRSQGPTKRLLSWPTFGSLLDRSAIQHIFSRGTDWPASTTNTRPGEHLFYCDS